MTSDEVKALVDRILSVRQDQDVLYGNLSDSLEDAEEALAGLRMGVRATVHLGDTGAELGYGKIGNKWHLFLARNGNETILSRVSVKWRILGAEHLPVLLQALVTQAEAQTQRIQGATAQVDRFLDAFKEVPRG